jgi:hypothetical protein
MLKCVNRANLTLGLRRVKFVLGVEAIYFIMFALNCFVSSWLNGHVDSDVASFLPFLILSLLPLPAALRLLLLPDGVKEPALGVRLPLTACFAIGLNTSLLLLMLSC